MKRRRLQSKKINLNLVKQSSSTASFFFLLLLQSPALSSFSSSLYREMIEGGHSEKSI